MAELIEFDRMTDEIVDLIKQANNTDYINEISEAEIRQLIQERTIRFLVDDDRIIGFAGWIRINDNWVELGPFFVSTDYQGQGLGKLVLNETIALTYDKYSLYAITSNPAMAGLLEKSGMERSPVLRLPFGVMLHLISKLRPGHIVQYFTSQETPSLMHFVRHRT